MVTVIFIARHFVPRSSSVKITRKRANSDDERTINTVVYRSPRRVRICFYSVGQSTSIQTLNKWAGERAEKSENETEGAERPEEKGKNDRKREDRQRIILFPLWAGSLVLFSSAFRVRTLAITAIYLVVAKFHRYQRSRSPESRHSYFTNGGGDPAAVII
jgi:hypothetical protein